MRQSRRYRKLGLTGGIGAGKSTAAEYFKRCGATVLDADAISRNALKTGGACYDAVVQAFGNGIVQNDGSIDRAMLASIVFSDESARRKLNSIVHPYVLETMESEAERLLEADPNATVIFDVPLLFECGLDRRMDGNIVVVAEDAVRIARIRARDGVDEAAARARIASQISQREQATRGDFVLDNGGTVSELHTQIDRLLSRIREGMGQ